MPLPWSSEADVTASFLRLPNGFAKTYVNWAATRTDAPIFFHIGALLPILATVTPKGLCLPEGPGGPVNPNFYSLLLGRQGYERKSTVTGIGARLLAAAAPGRRGDDPGSGEGFVASLAAQEQQMIEWSEFDTFLTRTQARSGGNYQGDLKAKVMDAWDGKPLSRQLAKKLIIAEEPRLSILAGVNPILLAQHSEPHDYRGGFYSRWGFFYAFRERSFGMVPADTITEEKLRGWLADTAGRPPSEFGFCEGLDSGAQGVWDEFSYAVEESVAFLRDEKFIGIHARAPSLALKAGLLLEFGCGAGVPSGGRGGQGWKVTKPVMEVAVDIASRCYQGAVAAFAGVESSFDMITRRAVLDAIDESPTLIGVITRRAKVLKIKAYPILQTLIAEGVVVPNRVGDETTVVVDPITGKKEIPWGYARTRKPGDEEIVGAEEAEVVRSAVEAARLRYQLSGGTTVRTIPVLGSAFQSPSGSGGVDLGLDFGNDVEVGVGTREEPGGGPGLERRVKPTSSADFIPGPAPVRLEDVLGLPGDF